MCTGETSGGSRTGLARGVPHHVEMQGLRCADHVDEAVCLQGFDAIPNRREIGGAVTVATVGLANDERYGFAFSTRVTVEEDAESALADRGDARRIATISEGALCVFLDGYTGREGKPVPLIIRKSDGGFGYGTTDLATVRYRIETLQADRLIYVIGAPQAVAPQHGLGHRSQGWLAPPDNLRRCMSRSATCFGEDRKILKTRSGAPLRLLALLDESVATARAVIDEARPDLEAKQPAPKSHRIVGIGAIKYADLSVAHDSEYVFDLERMVALTGNTGPYLQYAAARIRSIFRSC